VRVRISGDIATVAIKGPRIGIARPEFEYEIPTVDAERMLSTLCLDDTLEKQRFFVEEAGATWQVDVYGGILQGVVTAEIELKARKPGLDPPKLDWQGNHGRFLLQESQYARACLKSSLRRALVPSAGAKAMTAFEH
jgi:adenylate cyclase